MIAVINVLDNRLNVLRQHRHRMQWPPASNRLCFLPSLTSVRIADQIAQFPNMPCHSGGHRWRTTQRAVNAAEVIEREVKQQHCSKVFAFLRKAIREARKASQVRSH
jgi:hypothetical protein